MTADSKSPTLLAHLRRMRTFIVYDAIAPFRMAAQVPSLADSPI